MITVRALTCRGAGGTYGVAWSREFTDMEEALRVASRATPADFSLVEWSRWHAGLGHGTLSLGGPWAESRMPLAEACAQWAMGAREVIDVLRDHPEAAHALQGHLKRMRAHGRGELP